MGACRLPFVPDLFPAPALATFQERQRLDELVAVPYFDRLMRVRPHRPQSLQAALCGTLAVRGEIPVTE